MSENDIPRLFPDPEIMEAAGFLKMISRTPESQRLYDARLKFQRDEESRLRKARQDGLQAGLERGLEQGLECGLERGRLLGRISVLQQLLGVPESSEDEFALATVEQLSELEDQLHQQQRARRSS